MIDESKKREKLKFTEIEKLSQPIKLPDRYLLSGEIGFSRYCMDKILKEYANFPLDEKIHALFEHGVQITDYCEGFFRAHEYEPSIVPSKYRVEVLKKQKNYNGAYAIGPYIHYSKSLLNSDELNEEKERLGKTLLVFPSHSIEGTLSSFDYEKFCEEIDKYSSEFDSVRICMYYKDVNLKRFKPYEKKGFEIVSAGHFNDYNFMPRLKSIIEASDMTMSNECGSHLGYCIYLNKPHFLFNSHETTYEKEKNGEHAELMIKHANKVQESKINNENVKNIREYFSKFETKITNNQYELINYLWGFDEIKTPEELNNIFMEINNNHSQIRYYLSGLIRLKDLLKNGR